jgi:hypothetical protein
MIRQKVAAAACVLVCLLSSPAGAQDADRAGGSIAGQLGFVVGNRGYTELATGFRGGYTFPFHLYLGGDITFFLAGNAGTVFTLAPEVGYDIGVTRSFVIRPYGGLGFVDFTPDGATGVDFYPGCEFLYHVTRDFFLGGDVRLPLLFVPGGTVLGLNLMFTIGYKW